MSTVQPPATKDEVRWSIELQGDGLDLAEWGRGLQPGFDPSIDKIHAYGAEHVVLRSTTFAGLLEAVDVKRRAVPLMERLNGALGVTRGSDPVTAGRVVLETADGEVQFIALAVGNCRLRGTVATATGVSTDRDGRPVPPLPPQPSDAQRWLQVGEENDVAGDLLACFGKGDNWYDVYKTIELAEKLAGGESNLAKQLGENASRFKNLKATANYYRHARAHRPSPMATLTDARPLLAWVVRHLLDRLVAG